MAITLITAFHCTNAHVADPLHEYFPALITLTNDQLAGKQTSEMHLAEQQISGRVGSMGVVPFINSMFGLGQLSAIGAGGAFAPPSHLASDKVSNTSALKNAYMLLTPFFWVTMR